MTEIAGTIATGREDLAAKHVAGSGLEVGALDAPYPVDRATATVRYVDRFPKSDLLRHYPELPPRADLILDPDIVDDGETLSTLPDGSQDFVIASHFLEHCENPLQTLANHCRVLRPGGRLLIAIPDTANPASYDHGRVLTSFDHLIRDDTDGPAVSREEHYGEWVTFAGKMNGAVAEAEKTKLMLMNYSIHFHCWVEETFHAFIAGAIRYKRLPLTMVDHYVNDYEVAVVLRKDAAQAAVNRAGLVSRWLRRMARRTV